MWRGGAITANHNETPLSPPPCYGGPRVYRVVWCTFWILGRAKWTRWERRKLRPPPPFFTAHYEEKTVLIKAQLTLSALPPAPPRLCLPWRCVLVARPQSVAPLSARVCFYSALELNHLGFPPRPSPVIAGPSASPSPSFTTSPQAGVAMLVLVLVLVVGGCAHTHTNCLQLPTLWRRVRIRLSQLSVN